jgi:hypothetical protein
MNKKSVFNPTDAAHIIDRIHKLTPSTTPNWGKMNVGQMLAHTNVTYELVYDEAKHPKPTGFLKFMLKALVKKNVVSEKPYKKNERTGPQFLITDQREFEHEKKRLIDHINKTQQLGEDHFHGKESHSFGALNKTEWNNMFYKHLDHHLTQFGV